MYNAGKTHPHVDVPSCHGLVYCAVKLDNTLGAQSVDGFHGPNAVKRVMIGIDWIRMATPQSHQERASYSSLWMFVVVHVGIAGDMPPPEWSLTYDRHPLA